MNGSDRPWDDMYHRSYFLLEIYRIKKDDFISTLSKIVGQAIVQLYMNDIYDEENMESISPIITIDIYFIPGKVENVYIGADCFLEEIMIYTELFK
jgi:hypothetical protein